MVKLVVEIVHNNNSNINNSVVKKNYVMDIDPKETIDITFNIADINNIAARNSSFSKTIIALDTDNNREIFKYISDLNFETNGYDEVYYNPNKKTRCWLIVDSIINITGYLQLNKVNINHDTRTIGYEINIYDTTQNLYTNIADKKLNEIDFSDLNHIYNQTNVYNSWVTDYNNGYYYPFIDYNKNWSFDDVSGWQPNRFLKTSDFKPTIYTKAIFDRIVYGAGYSYTSTFLNSTRFRNLINTVTDKYLYGSTFSNDKLFKVSSLNKSQTLLDYPYPGIVRANHNAHWVDGTADFTNPVGTFSTVGIGTYQLYVGGIAVGQKQGVKIKFDDETTTIQPDNFDANNLFNTSIYEYTHNTSDIFSQRLVMNLEMFTRMNFNSNEATDGRGKPLSDTLDAIQITLYREFDPNTGTTYPQWNNGLGWRIPHSNGTSDDFYIYADGTTNFGENTVELSNFTPNATYSIWYNGYGIASTYIKTTLKTDWLDNRPDTANRFRPLYNGEKVRAVIRWYCSNTYVDVPGAIPNPITQPTQYNSGNWLNALHILGGTVSTGEIGDNPNDFGASSHFVYTPNTNIYNEVSNEVIPGGLINFNNNLPDNITQADFISSIVKMFNLYIAPDPDNEFNLLIEPRDDFYNNGQLKDWTDKLDHSSPIDVQILAEKQNKQTVFSYKQDSDYYNTLYYNNFNETYGQCTYEIAQNEYIKGKKEVNVIFSPTPLTKIAPFQNDSSKNFIISQILKDTANDSNGYKFNMRILQRYSNGLYTLNYGNILVWDNVVRRFHTYNGYPYAGHLDDPFTPTFDLCWALPRRFFYPNNITGNNLVNTYWLNTLNEISGVNSRIITARFRLSPVDIHNFKFSDTIILTINGDNIGGGSQYYRVNKISGYNPNESDSICEVELIKADNVTRTQVLLQGGLLLANNTSTTATIFNTGTATVYTGNPVSNTGNPAFSVIGYNNTTNPFSSFSNNTSNIINNGVSIGANNIINSPAISNGNDNKVAYSATNIMLNGNNININAGVSHSFVIGDNVEVAPKISNVFVVGSDVKVTNSDTAIFTVPLRQFSNRICAGIDEVLGEFSDGNIINRVSAGQDMILGYGSYTAINRISSGNDSVL